MEILVPVQYIRKIVEALLIAEIGNFTVFLGYKLASWFRVVPNVYHSAYKFYNWRITTRVSKVTTWTLK